MEGLNVDFQVVAFFALGLVLLYGLGWLLMVPFRMVLRFLFNGLIGGALLVLLNLFGSMFGLTVAINPLTALLAGFLGIPGVILVVVLTLIL